MDAGVGGLWLLGILRRSLLPLFFHPSPIIAPLPPIGAKEEIFILL